MQEYFFLTHDKTDPYFNLASEEYLLKHRREFFIYLWINSPAVILGVNQNAFQEVNLNYVRAHDVKVVRRLTGGGAVYHDLNNLCYTFIAPYDENSDSYEFFARPIVEYLNSLGLNAEFSGRNDITVDGKKISGTAKTVYGDRIMCHGTLLVDTDGAALENSLKPNKLKIESKGIKSVRKRVANIKDFLPDISVGDVKKGLTEKFLKTYKQYSLDEKDLGEINRLVKEKYSTFEWNMGKSPKGKNVLERKFSYGIVSLYFDTYNGKIVNPEIKGDFFSVKDVKGLEKSLDGVDFTVEAVKNALKDIGEYIRGADAESFVSEMFS